MDPSLLVSVSGLVLLAVLVAAFLASRYKVAGPDQAFLVTGRRGRRVASGAPLDSSGQKVVVGGGVFVWPFVQRLHRLNLSSRRIPVTIRGAVSGQGVKLNLEGVAIVKVGGNEDSIRAAAQRFLTQQQDIETFTQEVLAGALRSIVGGLTVEQTIRDRAAFAQRVADESESSLTGQGLVLDTLQIQDITDDGTYLTDLGRPEAARIQQEAAVAEAEARRIAEQARLRAEEEIANAQRQLVLRQAEIRTETDAANARAAAAGPMAQADREQALLTEQEKVAERQAALTERQLDTQVRRPADAARYRVEQEAEAQRTAEIARANAEKARRVAMSEAVRIEGEAEAAAVLARGSAEAEAMDKRATAFRGYGDAAVLEMLTGVLPQVAREVAAPMAAIDKLTVVSADGAGTLPRQVNDNVLQTLELLRATTGLDLGKLAARATASGRDGQEPADSGR
ncbi:MAG: flotillin family protein [Kineosporiaceae bacterium]